MKPSTRSTSSTRRKPRPVRPAGAPFMIADLAHRWRTSDTHVISLIDEGLLRALNIAGLNTSSRRFWRIPPESVAEFERLNSSLLDPKTGQLLPPKAIKA